MSKRSRKSTAQERKSVSKLDDVMTFRECETENPHSFEFVLEALADVLIDLAQRDGTIQPA